MNNPKNFIKIKYPFAAAAADPYNFAFGAQGFMNYEILLYNYSTNADATQKTFYEFNKCFGIGNKGTSNAYHIGLEQTQSAIDPINIPAVISTTNGDLFYRKRRVPYGYKYTYEAGNQDIPQHFSEWVSTELRLYFGQSNFAFANANYEINAQAGGLEIDKILKYEEVLADCLKDDAGISRPFAMIQMGGDSNGSTLHGHNYTYVGSTWGSIVQIIIDKKCMNPIIFIDEVDAILDKTFSEYDS